MKISPSTVLVAAMVLAPSLFGQGGGLLAPASRPASGSKPSANSTPDQSFLSSASSSGNNSNGNGDGKNAPVDNVWGLADKILNSDGLSMDSENGVLQWNKSKFDIGNNLVVRTRFVGYLSSPGFPDTATTYQQVLKQIQGLLANDPGIDGNLTEAQKNDRVYQAWQLLSVAAQYPQDGGASETLANQVYNAWRVRGELSTNREQYAYLQNQEKLRQKDVTQDTSKTSILAEQSAQQAGGKVYQNYMSSQALGQSGAKSVASQTHPLQGSSQTVGSSPATNSASPTNVINYVGNGTTPLSPNPSGRTTPISQGGSSGGMQTVQTKDSDNNGAQSQNPETAPGEVGTTVAAIHSSNLARTYAQEALLDADASTMGLEAKLQYQTQLLAFIGQRRFQHSLMAGQFYEHLFKGSQQRMNVAADEMSKYINSDSAVPSVNNFEFISHEAMDEVNKGMQTVESAYDAGDRWTALQQLQQTFLLGENLPAVQQFDAAKRRVLLTLYRDANDLRNAMGTHDFTSAEESLKKIQAEANDFESSPVNSAIKSAEQTSSSYVMAASQAAVAGDSDRVADNLKKATEIWPLNPDISNMSKNMLSRANLQDVGTKKFDELLAQKNDRAIYESRDEIGLAIFQDADRAAAFKAILNRMGQVDMAVSFADQAMKQNNGYAAWETLQAAADIEPNDPVLANAMRNVAPRVASFVSALDSADRASKAGDYAAALNYYLQAQDIYPASRISHDAIADVGAKLMDKLNPKGPSTKSATDKPASGKDAPAPVTPASNGAGNKTSSL